MTAVLLALLVASAPADSVRAPCPGGRVVTRADLDAAGAVFLHDAIRLASPLDAVTVDGFDREPVGTWGVPFGRRVRILVDGAPAASATGLEPGGVAFLPVAPGEVSRVVVCPGPGVAGGAWGGPWIDVQTAPPARLAYASATYGNEVGDPGPARYLDPSLPNVDHWGPDFEAAAVARRGRSAAWVTARDRSFFPTDTAMAARVFSAFGAGRYPSRSGPGVSVAAAAPGLRVRAGWQAGLDLPHVPEVGREVPVERRLLQATASVHRSVRGARLRGHVHATALDLDRHPLSTLALDPAWSETRFAAAASVEGPAWGGRLAAGGDAEHVAADGPGLADGTVTLGRLWAHADRQRERTGWAATVQGSASGSGLGGGGSASGRVRLRSGLDVGATLAAERALPEADPDFALWTRRGYAGLRSAEPALVFRTEASPADHALARLDAAAQWAAVQVEASVEGRLARGPVRLAEFVREGVAVGGAVRERRAEGAAVQARAAATWSGGPFQLRATGRVQGAVAGDDSFFDVWRRLPRVQAAVEATARPDGRLALWGRAEARTGTAWAGFPDPDVPGAVLLDLGLSKRAWGDGVRLSLAGRNVLGATEQTHPLGATLAPRLLLRLEFRL